VKTRAERLEALRNRLTRYEIAAIHPMGERLLIAYSQAHSRHGLLAACRKRGELLIRALGITDTDMLIPAPKAADGFTLGHWTVRYTGRFAPKFSTTRLTKHASRWSRSNPVEERVTR
jgi:hypothetical protein